MQLTLRDRTIIQLVHSYRFLPSRQILALLGNVPQPLLRRLQLLYHHGYLERPRAQLDYYHQGGSRYIVYGLGSKGAAILSRDLGLVTEKARWGDKNRSIGRIFLEHALLVSDVMVAIELACRATGHIRLLTEQELPLPAEIRGQGQPFRWTLDIGNGVNLGVIPDRVFALEVTDAEGHLNRRFFFLEADRGTMPIRRHNLSQTSFYRKLLAYQATWSQAVHRKRFAFHRFRVLTVTTSPERVSSLVEACSELSSGHGLFLFADRTILDKPGDTLSFTWQSGRAGLTGTLLD